MNRIFDSYVSLKDHIYRAKILLIECLLTQNGYKNIAIKYDIFLMIDFGNLERSFNKLND